MATILTSASCRYCVIITPGLMDVHKYKNTVLQPNVHKMLTVRIFRSIHAHVSVNFHMGVRER